MSLCSSGFRKFINTMHDCDSGVFDAMGKSIDELAKEMGIGRMSVVVNVRTTELEPAEKSVNRVIYRSEQETDDTRPYRMHFETENGTIIDLAVYPLKTIVWEEDALADIDTMFRLIYSFIGRVRLRELVKIYMSTDPITGALNMYGLRDFLTGVKARNLLSEYTGAYINIKGFRYVNNKVGARQSEDILKKFCRQVLNKLDRDESFCRLGGDNFILLVKTQRADSLIQDITNTNVDVGPITFNIKSRAGVYGLVNGDTLNNLLNCTSIALTEARLMGNQDIVYYDSAMLHKAMHANEVKATFTEALEGLEFEVYYQPKVELVTGRLCGCEALVRWKKNGRIINPAEFISILEHEGSVTKLDFFVLEAVCRDIKRWKDNGLEPVCVSTNFSGQHMHNESLAIQIIDTVNGMGIEHGLIETEITDITGYEDTEAISAFMKRMKENGIAVSIDGFGFGCSHLSLLKYSAVDIIKFHRTMIATIGEDSNREKIVIGSIMDMTEELGVVVVAEGVETKEQARFLRDAGCSIGQGFLFDRPMPASEFEKLLAENKVYEI